MMGLTVIPMWSDKEVCQQTQRMVINMMKIVWSTSTMDRRRTQPPTVLMSTIKTQEQMVNSSMKKVMSGLRTLVHYLHEVTMKATKKRLQAREAGLGGCYPPYS